MSIKFSDLKAFSDPDFDFKRREKILLAENNIRLEFSLPTCLGDICYVTSNNLRKKFKVLMGDGIFTFGDLRSALQDFDSPTLGMKNGGNLNPLVRHRVCDDHIFANLCIEKYIGWLYVASMMGEDAEYYVADRLRRHLTDYKIHYADFNHLAFSPCALAYFLSKKYDIPISNFIFADGGNGKCIMQRNSQRIGSVSVFKERVVRYEELEKPSYYTAEEYYTYVNDILKYMSQEKT